MRSAPNKKRETGLFKEVWIAYNNLVDFCREIAPQQSGSHGVMVDRKSNGTSFRVVPKKEEGESQLLKQVTLVSSSGGSLQCVDDSGATLIVQKPFPFEGGSSRTITVAGRSISESVYPPYNPGDRLLIGPVEQGSNSVFEWQDVTVGRCWRIDLKEVAVCISGDDNWRMLVEGSSPYRPT